MELWELVARESIRDLVGRYNANGDSGRFDQVLQCFAPDAVMEIDGEAYEGRENIRRIFTDAAAAALSSPVPVVMRHSTSTLQIDVVSPTEATSRCYYQVLTGQGLDHWGRYLDAYGVIDGKWYFVHRREFLDGSVPNSWAEYAVTQQSGG
jgi:ketosteroid isomerase-like protein